MYYQLLFVDHEFEYHDKEPIKKYLIKMIVIKFITFRVYVPGNNIFQNSPKAVTFESGVRLSIITCVDGIGWEYWFNIKPLTPIKKFSY